MIGSLQERDLLDRVFKNPDALQRGRRRGDAAAARDRRRARSLDEVFADLTGRERGRRRRRGGPAGRRCSRAPTCSSTSRSQRTEVPR